MFAKLAVVAFAIGVVVAIPYPGIQQRTTWTDPAYSVSTATLAAAITCPNGVKNKAGGIVFLVHGTGSSGSDTWAKGPYNLILPTYGPGYDICWVDLPGHGLGNAATSAEYVAYNIKTLAAKSATGKVFVIGHSQGGGLNPQWALDFFPSTQAYVSGYVALSGDFHGTSLGGLACFGIDFFEGHCAESIFQQDQKSQYLKAQNTDGGKALVGTTSIFTSEDEIIPPEPLDSTLTGASNILIQSVDACSPTHINDHFLAPFDSGYFGLALDALTHGGVASTSRFDKAYCLGFPGNITVDASGAAAALKSVFLDVFNVLTVNSPYVSTKEPPLPEYVCQRYPTAGYTCAAGPLN